LDFPTPKCVHSLPNYSRLLSDISNGDNLVSAVIGGGILHRDREVT